MSWFLQIQKVSSRERTKKKNVMKEIEMIEMKEAEKTEGVNLREKTKKIKEVRE